MKTINNIVILIILIIIGIFFYYDYQHQVTHNHRPEWVTYLLIVGFGIIVILAANKIKKD